MSIKDLFGKTSKDLKETVQDVESVKFVEEKSKQQERYLPPVDFSDPKNFVYYGSAELYYDAAIRRIYEDYPYDGSKAEQIEFEEKSSHLERWLFENRYPKTTGYIELGTTGDLIIGSGFQSTGTPEYIRVWGGLHTQDTTRLEDKFDKSAKYDESKNRNQNWNCDFEQGATIEFWMKKDTVTPTGTSEVILDLWNGESGSDIGRVLLYTFSATTNVFFLRVESGTSLFQGQIQSDSLDILNWHHYAISMKQVNNQFQIRFYIDGVEDSLHTSPSTFPQIEGKIDGFIGAMQAPFGFYGQGDGKLSAKLDEFRFWKTARTARQIKLNWFSQVGGGANTDDATSDLGVYFKFNEGVVGNIATDSVVLDYSGRLANGLWVGYPGSSARNTGSAIESVGYNETATPIIYSNHPEVTALSTEMQTSGSFYDAERGQAFFNSMPTWLQQDDNGNLRKISQILASYLDTLHVQIKQMTELKNKDYTPEGLKASTMAQDLLKDKGFMTSNIFGMNEVYEKLSDLDIQDGQFESDLNEIKNIIYTNIYNNLEKIYKSKGTETSIRNFIRCFGIDDELVRLNLYTDGGVQYLSDKSRVTSVKKKYINFNHPDHFSATIYQTSSADNSNTFISGSSTGTNASNNAFTLEADIVVPYKKERGENGYFGTPFLSSSVFGFHEANEADEADYTFASTYGMQVYLVKDSSDSRSAKFVLDLAGTQLESDYVYDIYENTHWNIAISIKPETYPYAGGVTNTTPDYEVSLYAVSHDMHEGSRDYNEVGIYATLGNADGLRLTNMAKRVYAGAHRQDFTGAVLQKSDVEIGSIRGWLDYLEDEEIQNHNKDVLNYGSRRSIDGSNIYTVDNKQIPTQDLTILNWDFDTVLGADGSGQFIVEDTTSGSTDTIYGWVDDVIRREHRARGDFFPSEDSSFLSNEFLYSLKKQLPETAYNSENIFIKGEQEINFSDDDDVSDNLFILEKSPANLVSEEMLKSFSTTMEFANLVGRPIDRYRLEYKDLAKARELFFNKVESDLDFDRFFEYFKWIDSSISSMVNQLIPLSANFAGGIVDVIEPHILERDKYQRQIGLLNTVTSTEASIRGVQELNYNWKFGHAPVSGDEADHCLWQKERKERDEVDREQIRQVLVRQNDQEFTNPINLSGSDGVYQGRTYATRRFSKPYSVNIGFSNSIHGGINYSINKDRYFLATVTRPHGETGTSNAPKNIMTIGAGDGHGLNPLIDCNDVENPNALIKRDGEAQIGKFSSFAPTTLLDPLDDSLHYVFKRKISSVFPGNIVSSSVNTGYASKINKSGLLNGFKEGINVVNLHSDTTDITNEIPMQGPFTHQWMGGHQSRHVDINKVGRSENFPNELDNKETRPEAWRLLVGTNPLAEPGDTDGAMGFTGPDYGSPYPVSGNLLAIYYREERTKRPVNIKNIRTNFTCDESGGFHLEGPLGNYIRRYEYLSNFGDLAYYFRRQAGRNLLPEVISDILPQTTHYHSLIAQTASAAGNFFGPGNNRQYDPTCIFIPGDPGTPDTPGQIADGAEFTVFGPSQYTQGDYITIDGDDYEIETSTQGGTSIDDQPAGTDVQFYDNFLLALQGVFANPEFSVAYSELTSSVSIPETGKLVVYGKDNNVSLWYQATPSWAASHLVTTQKAITYAFYINTPAWTESGTAQRNIYGTLSQPANALSNSIVLRGGDLRFAFGYRNGTQQNLARFQLDNFVQTYAGTDTHVIITTNGNPNSGQFNCKLYINGTYTAWDFEPDPNDTTGNFPDFISNSNTNTVSQTDQFFIASGYPPTSLIHGLGTPQLGTTGTGNVPKEAFPSILDEFLIFDQYYGNNATAISEIYNNGNVWNYNNLANINTYQDAQAFYTFGESGDGFKDGDTIHNRVVNSPPENPTVYDVDGYRTPDLGHIDQLITTQTVSQATFTITPLQTGSYGNFDVIIDPGVSSFFNPTSSVDGTDLIPGIDPIPDEEICFGESNIVEAPNTEDCFSSTIRSRFSAPGGPEVLTTSFRSVHFLEFSVHNSLNYRNLMVRSNGSGEEGTIRVNSHSNRREGLRTLRARHQGQFGIDSQHGAISATNYVSEASFHKQHRNTSKKLEFHIQRPKAIRVPVEEPDSGTDALKTNMSTESEIDLVADSLVSFSFWFKAEDSSDGSRALFGNPILNANQTGINFEVTSLGGNISTVDFSVQDTNSNYRFNSLVFSSPSVPVDQWNQFIISLELDGTYSFANSKVTINGVENDSINEGVATFTGDIKFGRFLAIGETKKSTSDGRNQMVGSMMNFGYYDSFIHNNSSDIEIIENHTDGSEIGNITSLKAFWFLGNEFEEPIEAVVPDPVTINSSYGKTPLPLLTILTADEIMVLTRGFYYGRESLIRVDDFDNNHLASLLPSSDFQYSWINSSISGSNWEEEQKVLGFAPSNGLISSSAGITEAIVFPTISSLYGE